MNKIFPRRLIYAVTLCFLAFHGVILFAQEKGTVRGIVTDSLNGQPIGYVNLVIKGTRMGASSSSSGYYLIPAIPEGKQLIVVSHLSYESKTVAVNIQKNSIMQLNVQLIPRDIQSNDVIITGERPSRPNAPDLGLQTISTKEVEMVPSGMEVDIFRALQSNPGVGVTSDISARYYVRGGGSDQNLVLLNGATVYNPFHTLGIFSVVDPEMVSLLEFHKGGFPPVYGGRLSSILNVVTRDGNRNAMHGVANASFISGKVALEGPMPNGSFLVTGRKSWYASVMKKYLSQLDAPFDFYDLSWKTSYSSPAIDENSRFAFHGFFSGDRVVNDDPFREDYSLKNKIVGANWHKIWSNPLYSTVSVTYSGFDGEVMPKLSSSKPRKNVVSDISADLDFTYIYESGDELYFGWQNRFVTVDLNLLSLLGNKFSFHQYGNDVSLYADYRLYKYENFGMTAGIRFKLLAISKYRPVLYEPRGSLLYRLNPTMSVKASFGWYSQEMMTLADENELISIFEPWIITPDYLNSARAFHLSVGTKILFTENTSLECEGYYKTIADLIDENQKKFTAKDRDFVNVDGESYGIELLALHQLQRLYLKSSYALSWSFKLKDGNRFIPRYDVRHALNILAGYEFENGWQASITWSFRTGMPYTPVAGFYDRAIVNPWSSQNAYNPFESVMLWGKRYASRLPTYHRLDIGCSKVFSVGGASITAGVNIINLYDRKNIFYFDRDTGEQVFMLQFTPSASLKVEL
ncbi:MAG: TonB-dependent receptor [bacterium]